MANKLWLTLPLTVAFFCLCPVDLGQAAPKGSADPDIAAVIPDYENDYLDIWGNNLSDGIEPYTVTVILDEQVFEHAEIVSATPNNVVVDVGTFFDDNEAGDYRLVYDSGLKNTDPVEMMLTLGAAGPQGPSGHTLLENESCSSGQFLAGFDAQGQIICSGVRIPGDSCPSSDYCESGLFCTDDTCCSSSCDGICETCSSGSCEPVPEGQDPDDECDGASCSGYFFGWIGDTCYASADVTDSGANCNGSGACLSTAALCASSGQGAASTTCDSTCQEPTGGTCSGTTTGQCTNINPGPETCGVGECLRTTQVCFNGTYQACTPGTPVAEICNGKDDDCDGEPDEDFNLFTDPANCGGCDQVCEFGPHSTTSCISGICYLNCDAGWFDCNADPSDGCEEAALPFGASPCI